MNQGITTLPVRLRSLFWSYDFDKLELGKNKRLIFVQVVNYGRWQDWQWLAQTYGSDELIGLLREIPATELRPQARKLLALLLRTPEPIYAFRGAHR